MPAKHVPETGTKRCVCLKIVDWLIHGTRGYLTTHLVLLIPVSCTLFTYFIVSSTGSTGGLQDMNTTSRLVEILSISMQLWARRTALRLRVAVGYNCQHTSPERETSDLPNLCSDFGFLMSETSFAICSSRVNPWSSSSSSSSLS